MMIRTRWRVLTGMKRRALMSSELLKEAMLVIKERENESAEYVIRLIRRHMEFHCRTITDWAPIVEEKNLTRRG